MNIVLNSRILVGSNHDAAARIAQQWRPGLSKDIEWMLSLSDLCVLSITRSQGEPETDSPFGRSGFPPTLALTNGLEDELRRHLGLRLPVGKVGYS